jgi:hypothetical protein
MTDKKDFDFSKTKWENLNPKKILEEIWDRDLRLEKRIADLEKENREFTKQIRELRAVKYCGVFQKALQSDYEKGNLCTFGGSLWCALKDSPSGAPGTSADSWQLVVKQEIKK